MFLEEADSTDREEACAVLHRQAGKVDEVDPCVAVLVAWALALWGEVSLLQAITTTAKVLMDKALHHVNSRRTVKAIGVRRLSLLWP